MPARKTLESKLSNQDTIFTMTPVGSFAAYGVNTRATFQESLTIDRAISDLRTNGLEVVPLAHLTREASDHTRDGSRSFEI